MKRYLLFIIFIFILSFWFSFAESDTSLNETFCPIFFDALNDFDSQKLELESQKQELKYFINDAYWQLQNSSDKEQKDYFKTQIFAWKKEIIGLNYKLFLLYKNKYFSRITY